MHINVVLIGDYQTEVTAHKAIPLALQINGKAIDRLVKYTWIGTESIVLEELNQFDALWCVPASPYKNTEAALAAIRFARENSIPYLGTCGGYQHAVLEYARNVLGYGFADNTETNPAAVMPLISALSCQLIEQGDVVRIHSPSQLYSIYQTKNINEKYHCSYGVNPQYLPLFEDSDLKFSGFDDAGEPRAFELVDHKFFIGTAFQPERSALTGDTHPLIEAFLRAAGK